MRGMSALKLLDITLKGDGRLRIPIARPPGLEIRLTNMQTRPSSPRLDGAWAQSLCHIEHMFHESDQELLDQLLQLPRLRSMVLHRLRLVDFSVSASGLESLELVDSWGVDLAGLDSLQNLAVLRLRNESTRQTLMPCDVSELARGRLTELLVSRHSLLVLRAGCYVGLDLAGFSGLRTLTLEAHESNHGSGMYDIVEAVCGMTRLENLRFKNVTDYRGRLGSLRCLASLDIGFLGFRVQEEDAYSMLQSLVLRDVSASSGILCTDCVKKLQDLPALRSLTLVCSEAKLWGLMRCEFPTDNLPRGLNELRLVGLRPTHASGIRGLDTLYIERASFELLSAEVQAQLKSIKNLYVVTKVQV
jgi:hypothetical protein